MDEVCKKHNIKLLTYGTLVRVYLFRHLIFGSIFIDHHPHQCGGFLADEWLGKPEPGAYENSMTPSQRKVSVASHVVGAGGGQLS